MNNWILFTGHMIDAKERKHPRFPANKEKMVRKEISKHLLKIKDDFPDAIGVGGAACGGDILFHELCMEMDIPSEIYLALPIAEFKNKSVSFAGQNWVERFNKLTNELPVHVLPVFLEKEKNVWEQANNWMLKAALKNGGEHMALIALWDRKAGDGGGGTEHMVSIAKDEKAVVEIIDINKI